MTNNITVSKMDLFNVANADDGEKLELARIGLIDLSVSELLEIRARARSAIEQAIERERNPRKRARLQATLSKVDDVRAANAALAGAILEKQQKAN